MLRKPNILSRRIRLRVLNFNISRPKSWQDIAEQVQEETDPEKLCQLSRELIAAIDSQVERPIKKHPRSVKLDKKKSSISA